MIVGGTMISIEDRHWPLVIFRYRGEVSMSDLEGCLATQEEMILRNRPSVSLVLTEDLKMWETAVLRRQAQWIKEHRADLQRLSLGVALVISSPVVRGTLRAVLYLQPIPQPHVVVGSSDLAMPWLRTKLLEANITAEIPERF